MLWAKGFIKNIANNLFEYIFPYSCICCSDLVVGNNAICVKCIQKFDFISKPYCFVCGTRFAFYIQDRAVCARCIQNPPSYDKARSLLYFNYYSKKLLYLFKYYDKTICARFFAKLLIQRYKDDLDNLDFVVPVPMHRIKRLYRYYNPSELLAKEIAILINKKLIPDLLIKVKWTKSQTGLSKAKRINNLKGSIHYNNKYNIKNKSILLIDDVHTTGTTSNICSMILKKASAYKVNLLTISRT